jgi:hypothetical protein
MTSVLEAPLASADEPGRTRRRWPWVAGALALLLLIGATVTGVVYAHTYQPLSADGGLTGPASERTIKSISDGLRDTNWVLVGPAGTRGVVDYTLANNGPFAVTIQGLDRSRSYGITGLRWAPVNGPNGGGNGYEPGLVSESRSLPVTIPAHSAVLIQVTVTQFRCTRFISGQTVSDIPIRWSGVGVHHSWDLQLVASQFNRPIVMCPSKSVLAHVDH